MKPLRFLCLISLGAAALTILAFKDFRGSKIAVVSIERLARERAEGLAQQNLKGNALNAALRHLTKTLNQDLDEFASKRKVILFTSHTLKGGAEDLTEDFKAYVSSKKGENT